MSVLLKTKLRNMVESYSIDNFINPHEYEYHLSNIVINGDKRGCSGFIVDKITGHIVYVNTEHKYLYRKAKSIKDFSGGVNRYTNVAETLVKLIVESLNKGLPD